MKILVAVASRHGSTREIAEAVAEGLRAARFSVDVADPDDVETLDPYGAVLVGSSVYVGRWAASARAMVDRLAPALSVRPLWLFSSGPVGNPPFPAGDPEEVAGLVVRLRARGHRTFSGRLDRGGLALAERAVVSLIQAEHGDFRSWRDVQEWAQEVADELHADEIRDLNIAR